MSKKKKKQTVIALPNWSWWQCTIMATSIITVFRFEGGTVLAILKAFKDLMPWS